MSNKPRMVGLYRGKMIDVRVLGLLLVVACSADSAKPAAPVVAVVPVVVKPPPCEEVRYALTSSPFEPVQDISLADLKAAASAGRISVREDIAHALGIAPHNGGAWQIIPADQLTPERSVITVGGVHPLFGGLVGCGVKRNIDPLRITTVVMSGTTALTGRTAERIDSNGIADTIRFIAPFFTSADIVHVSNEVGFVATCDPKTGQDRTELRFCSRDHYIDLLAALHVNIIELTGSHLTDYGQHTLERTVQMYAQRKWQWFGGGPTQRDAVTPKLVEDHGNTIGFVGCNAVNEWVHEISAGPGTATCDWPRMIWQIQDMRRRGIVPIATVQHREVRTHAPPADLVEDLRRLAGAGAAFVEGSQAHVAHPWDVHAGAYVHYGPGNTLFAQYRDVQRDAVIDKLYIYAGKLVSVSHLYIRTEHGQPRLLTDREREVFLAELATAAQSIAPPDPTPAVIPPASRMRPESFVVRGRSQRLLIAMPIVPTKQIDAYVVTLRGKRNATDAEIQKFVRELLAQALL